MSANFDTKMEIIGRMLDRRKEQQSDLNLLNELCGTSITLNWPDAKEMMLSALDEGELMSLHKLAMAACGEQRTGTEVEA
jgi:hypothetical protein